ncbi:hemerythrin HHE cation binding domain protein [Collimonas arenae]|uniref:Hemerythrin HHE cation binding domain protein n=1 Tax=Collimonas arenae TaxID=279058 RepID=A0A127QNA7_9BURK|nr:hemerythrin domain-containing protein [Collimonas arenae]AMP01629.1 hemerythrin HHE cation binding domain protein [Collimonas arenae]AMP11524.1 hemerythrin HHE cation binding domain protein [Collimonas arenae]
MPNALIATAPDFSQPIAVLKHCHDRIRKQLDTLQNLLEHLPQHGNDAQAQQAAQSIMRYFNQAAPHHHADEEVDLLPMLSVTASGEDAALLQKLMPEIMAEHQQMDKLWHALDQQLTSIADGESTNQLSAQDVQQFSAIYSAHMEKEETWIAPMAKRLFNEQQMQQLGSAMQQRRGISV